MDTSTLIAMLSPGAPLLEKIIRVIIIYAVLVAGLRLAGKREMAQLNTMDFVVLLTLSNAVQNAIIGSDNSLTGGIISALTLLLVNYLLVRFLYRHRRMNEIIEGTPTVLIDNGRILHRNLSREVITLAELKMAAHKQGIDSLDDISRALIGPEGFISFVSNKPPMADQHHRDIVERLDTLTRELKAVKRMVDGSGVGTRSQGRKRSAKT